MTSGHRKGLSRLRKDGIETSQTSQKQETVNLKYARDLKMNNGLSKFSVNARNTDTQKLTWEISFIAGLSTSSAIYIASQASLTILKGNFVITLRTA